MQARYFLAGTDTCQPNTSIEWRQCPALASNHAGIARSEFHAITK